MAILWESQVNGKISSEGHLGCDSMWCHNPEDLDLNFHCHENVKFITGEKSALVTLYPLILGSVFRDCLSLNMHSFSNSRRIVIL